MYTSGSVRCLDGCQVDVPESFRRNDSPNICLSWSLRPLDPLYLDVSESLRGFDRYYIDISGSLTCLDPCCIDESDSLRCLDPCHTAIFESLRRLDPVHVESCTSLTAWTLRTLIYLNRFRASIVATLICIAKIPWSPWHWHIDQETPFEQGMKFTSDKDRLVPLSEVFVPRTFHSDFPITWNDFNFHAQARRHRLGSASVPIPIKTFMYYEQASTI